MREALPQERSDSSCPGQRERGAVCRLWPPGKSGLGSQRSCRAASAGPAPFSAARSGLQTKPQQTESLFPERPQVLISPWQRKQPPSRTALRPADLALPIPGWGASPGPLRPASAKAGERAHERCLGCSQVQHLTRRPLPDASAPVPDPRPLGLASASRLRVFAITNQFD